MGLGEKFKIWKFEKTRLDAFSDGVFAIIITILVTFAIYAIVPLLFIVPLDKPKRIEI